MLRLHCLKLYYCPAMSLIKVKNLLCAIHFDMPEHAQWPVLVSCLLLVDRNTKLYKMMLSQVSLSMLENMLC